MPYNHASAHSLAGPPTNYGSLIFCNYRVMSSGGSPPPESLDASRLPVPDGGGSTSVPVGWRPFKVSLMDSNEHSMRASSGDGGGGTGGVGGGRDDAPLPRPLRVLTILYTLTYITPKLSGGVQGRFKMVLPKLETGLGVSFLYLSVNRRYSIKGLARFGLGLSI
jgi:hypothetical protein